MSNPKFAILTQEEWDSLWNSLPPKDRYLFDISQGYVALRLVNGGEELVCIVGDRVEYGAVTEFVAGLHHAEKELEWKMISTYEAIAKNPSLEQRPMDIASFVKTQGNCWQGNERPNVICTNGKGIKSWAMMQLHNGKLDLRTLNGAAITPKEWVHDGDFFFANTKHLDDRKLNAILRISG